VIERYGFRDDAGGFGAWTGGAGVVLDYRVTSEEVVFSCGYGRLYNPPWGVAGGHDGLTSHAIVIRRDGSEEIYGKVSDVRVKRGELVRLVTATGGGWGPPRNRPRERVLADLRDGFITPGIARDIYGIADA
jgi:N-methylhydantoinase B